MKDNRETDDLSNRSLLKDILRILTLWSIVTILRNAFMKKKTQKETGNRVLSSRVVLAAVGAFLLVLGMILYAVVGLKRPSVKEAPKVSSGPVQSAENRPRAVHDFRLKERTSAKGQTTGEQRTEDGRHQTSEDRGQTAEGGGRPAGGEGQANHAAEAETEGLKEKEYAALRRQVDELNKEVTLLKERVPPTGYGGERPAVIPEQVVEKRSVQLEEQLRKEINRLQNDVDTLSKEMFSLKTKETPIEKTGVGVSPENGNKELRRMERQIHELGREMSHLTERMPAQGFGKERPPAGAEGGAESKSEPAEEFKQEVNRLQSELDSLSRRFSRLEMKGTATLGPREERRGLGTETAKGGKEEFGRVEREMKELRKEISQLETKETPAGMTVVLRDFLFEFGESDLMPGAKRSIELLADVLRRHPSQKILIEGFTDSIGAMAYNLDLSRRRADAVKRALVSEKVNPDRITTRGHGEDYPVATNETRAGRQLNRRVEVTLLNNWE